VTYETARALRQSIEHRMRLTPGFDVQRARRRIVFERLLSRLVNAHPERWVVKGGFALEVRLPERARVTRDIDLAVALDRATTESVRGLMLDGLTRDPDGDRFAFTLIDIRALQPIDAGRLGWRLSIRADLDGRKFETVTADIVARTTEDGRTERRSLQSSLRFAGVPDLDIDLVDLDHHFAEKLAAYTADRGLRENTRVKDLTDMVLLVETGVEPTRRLRDVAVVIFEARGESAPAVLPPPPASWAAVYAAQAAEVRLGAVTIADAHRLVQEFWFASAEEIL
jgi:predicted nucleotidyltransferase component of viral defense system